MPTIKVLGFTSLVVGEIIKRLVLGQFLPFSLELFKIIINKESQGSLRGIRDISIELKDSGLIVGISIHLIQSSLQTLDNIMVHHKHVLYSVLHRVKYLTPNNTIICISLNKFRIGFSWLRFLPKNLVGLVLSTNIEPKIMRPSMKVLPIQQHARDMLSQLRMRERNMNKAQSNRDNFLGWVSHQIHNKK